ncbi:MAG: translation initiation factor IF-2, partial [Chloroflexi bacterium]|nr:translation initiation factor IF-2 [Chloroflexota bacterium]
PITFLDTPGHEAFTQMRARGAKVTDIAVLVVAADDGVMPQTLEAIDHVKAAGVPLIVAINKIDLPTANADRVKQQLSQHGVLVEDWGGDTIAVPVSAKTKQGLADLLAAILLVAEVAELTADPDRPARGVVLEARLDPTRGPMATLLVQEGTLRPSDAVLAGEAAGRIRAMLSPSGERLKEAGPSTPVAVLGLDEVPRSGDAFAVVEDDKTAKERAEQHRRERSAPEEGRPSTLERLMGQIRAGEVQELNVIVKADVQGSLEAIRLSLERMATDRARVNIIHATTGTVTENDVLLAAASKALVLGFSTRVEPMARRVAASEGVDIRTYAIIYELISDVERALRGLLPTQYRQVLDGKAEVRQVFDLRRGKIAGCQVVEGRVRRGAQARLLRQGKVLSESTIASLRHFRDEAREMAAGQECGIALEGFDDFQAGDVIEAYRHEEVS